VKTAERQSHYFKRDVFGGTKPMKMGKRWADVRRTRQVRDDSCCIVEHGLQTAEDTLECMSKSRYHSLILPARATLPASLSLMVEKIVE